VWATTWHLHRHPTVPVPLGLEDLDDLVAGGGLRPPALRLMRAGQPVPPSAYLTTATVGSRPVGDWVHPGKAIALFEEGATLNFQGLQRFHPDLGEWCRTLEEALGHPVQANGYLSPAGTQGLKVHHDTHDVFVVQVVGTKTFELYETRVELPLKEQSWAATEPPGPAVATVVLRPGDCLYLPRGVPHRAFTGEGPSLHLTVGVLAVTWHRVVLDAVKEALAGDVRFRQPLPARFRSNPEALAAEAKELLAEAAAVIAGLDPTAVTEPALHRKVVHRPPALRGLLTELVTSGANAPSSTVPPNGSAATVWRRRSGAAATLREEGDRAVLVLEDRTVHFPAFTAPALALVLGAERVEGADLAEWLDPPGAAVLLRALHRDGLLTPLTDAP
jgi:bifunctional lysine-specific demethylase and histidyl-hydroxylase NO66